ncbi:hypothetical protein AYO40_06210 [Planctomycetaceae bacterium SCGC AG-212-D15]|nr:hypothetical protein AYO40_06210 [Planctomycetaceae bacterium SCGC AG-212-D15]
MAIVALVCSMILVVSGGLSVLVTQVLDAHNAFLLIVLALGVTGIVVLVEVLMILLFLRACALNLNQPAVARRCVSLLIAAGVLLAFPCAFGALGFIIAVVGAYTDLDREITQGVGVAYSFIGYSFFAMVWIWFILLGFTIGGVRTAVIRRTARSD